jgi:hypothetical protein
MGAVATRERQPGVPALDNGSAEPPGRRLFEPEGSTLEDAILATWQELATAEHAPCPVCAAELSRAGQCASCGSQLS